MEKALDATGGDALLNVTVYSSLYTFIPYFHIFTYTCTSVEGTAISYLPPPTPLPSSASTAMPNEPQWRFGRAILPCAAKANCARAAM